MKTITGKIVSSKPVPVERARSFLSEFVNTDTGASQAVSAYLRRATAAFDELLRVHSKSQRRRDGDVKEKDVEKGEERKGCVGDSRDGEGKKVIELKEEDGFGDGKKSKKKKKKKERERGSLEENVSVVRDREGGIKAEAKEEEGRGDVEERRLKRKSGGDEEEKEVGTEERKQSKKKKKRRKDGGIDV